MTAAQRGHDVTIYDKEDEIGGQARLIKKLQGHTMPQTFLDYLDRQVNKLGIKLCLGTNITNENIDEVLSNETPDVAVVATGARPAADGRSGLTSEPIPGWEQEHVCTYEDVLQNAIQPGQRVLIIDELGDRVSPGIAEMLAEQGKQVDVITRWPVFAPNLQWWLDAPFVMAKLDSLGINITTYSWVKGIKSDSALCFHICSMREFAVDVDTVVLATTKYSNTDLERMFQEKGLESHLIGDSKSPRWIWNATHDGYKLGREI
jgi:pyruvate/2-oxoglutarate dehydrogenase complex dihydrolipoamide dehydrogenase (E3) component